MPIIAKNIIIGDGIVKETPKQPVVKKIEVKQVIDESPEKYHHIKEGELHKMINKKSDYLTDMLALEKNK